MRTKRSGGATRAATVAALVLLLLAGGVALVPRAHRAEAGPNGYVTMPDGVQIAVNVRMPTGYVEGRKYPTVFEMSGYESGSADDRTLATDFGIPGLPHDDSRQLTRMFSDQYVTVHASLRGTGCSGGEFDLFSFEAARDGHHIIDEWIPKQPWSNGDVAIMGHSYSGITGFLVAATQPAHLEAVTVSGLIDDLYRGIIYPGGVTNYGFPLLWGAGIRHAYDVGGGLLEGLLDPALHDGDPAGARPCAEASSTRRRTVFDESVVRGMVDTDNEWYRSRSLVTYAKDIKVPIHITGAYQDEQTGPRFPHLWELVEGVSKRLLLTNGDHNVQNPAHTRPEIAGDRKAWVDHWLRVERHPAFGQLAQRRTSVTTLLETHRDAKGTIVSNGRLDNQSFPLETTAWQEWYLREDGGLSTAAPSSSGGASSYVSGSPRQGWSYEAGHTAGSPFTTEAGPDELTFRSAPLTEDTAVVGPITANLFVQSTAPDTELFVQLIDESPDPDRSRTYLQRGMLKASHRAVDPARSDHVDDGGTSRLYRPWRPHTNPQPIVPGETYEYLVEVFPVGHVFRAGHRVVVKVHTPPAVDSYYAYVPKRPPGVNTVLHDAAHPSRLSLPTVPLRHAGLGPALPTCSLQAVRCVPADG